MKHKHFLVAVITFSIVAGVSGCAHMRIPKPRLPLTVSEVGSFYIYGGSVATSDKQVIVVS